MPSTLVPKDRRGQSRWSLHAGRLGRYAAWVRGLGQRDALRLLDPLDAEGPRLRW